MASTSLTFRLDDALKAELESIAANDQRSVSNLVVRAVQSMVDQRKALTMAIDASEKEAAAGQFMSENRMMNWVNSWGADAELPPPEPESR